jgi:hypothetical protein
LTRKAEAPGVPDGAASTIADGSTRGGARTQPRTGDNAPIVARPQLRGNSTPIADGNTRRAGDTTPPRADNAPPKIAGGTQPRGNATSTIADGTQPNIADGTQSRGGVTVVGDGDATAAQRRDASRPCGKRENGCAVRRIDLGELGKGAVAAIEPVDVEVVESLQRRITALGWPSAITVTMSGGRVIVRVPAKLVFAKSGKAPELSDVATQIVRELSNIIAGYEMRSMRIVAAAGPEILELAGAFVVAGCDPARLEAAVDASTSTIDLALVPYRRRGP